MVDAVPYGCAAILATIHGGVILLIKVFGNGADMSPRAITPCVRSCFPIRQRRFVAILGDNRQQMEMTSRMERDSKEPVLLLHRSGINPNGRPIVGNDVQTIILQRNRDDAVVITGDEVPVFVLIGDKGIAHHAVGGIQR